MCHKLLYKSWQKNITSSLVSKYEVKQTKQTKKYDYDSNTLPIDQW
jgi:hypothetical protein